MTDPDDDFCYKKYIATIVVLAMFIAYLWPWDEDHS